MINRIYIMDALEALKQIESDCVNCGITSVPYYNLRDYGVPGQIGQEDTPEEFIEKLVGVFREFKRVLKNDGTLWVNIGDSYASNGGNRINGSFDGFVGRGDPVRGKRKPPAEIKAKDLIGIPWMLAFALRGDGWYLRQDIIWSKPNPMPESVKDRCTKSHEYIFMLSKSPKYYYDNVSIRTEAKESTIARMAQDIDGQKGSDRVPGKTNGSMKAVISKGDKQRGHLCRHTGFNERWDNMTNDEQRSLGANKRSVWEVATRPFKEAHFATFPPDLIVDCIKAGCPPGGVILDPFIGAFTTLITANKLGRNCIGIELNPTYVELGAKRAAKELGLFNSIEIIK